MPDTTGPTVDVEIKLVPGPRRGGPRAVEAVRARIAHTATNKRRLDVFVTEPVQAKLGWKAGGIVSSTLTSTPFPATVLLRPAHHGLRLGTGGKKSKTARVSITSPVIANGVCAPVRDVPFRVAGQSLAVSIPADWLVPAPVAEAA
jgi:hypothetical protein